MSTYHTTILDPTTYVAGQRVTWVLPPIDTVSNIRLGGLAAIIGGNIVVNTASGMLGAIDRLVLRVNGQTVQQINTFSTWAAYILAVGTADAGDSVLDQTTMSTQRFVPFYQNEIAAGPTATDPMRTIVCSNQATLATVNATDTHYQLASFVPFLATAGILQCSQYTVELELLFKSSFQNLLPQAANFAGLTFNQPYLVIDQLFDNIKIPPPAFDFIQIASDSVVIPTVTAGTAQAVALQSRGFVGRMVQDIVFCKTPGAYAITDEYSAAYDGSYAQYLEKMRLWVDGQAMTSFATNSALLESYCPPHRAAVVHQRPLMELYDFMADTNTGQTLGARSYPCITINRPIIENLQIDYERTGYGGTGTGQYLYGTRPINLIMFARCVAKFSFDRATNAVVLQ